MTTLHAALVTPLAGPLDLYGKAGATALTLWARKAAQLPAHFPQVELEVHDSADDLHAALHTALQKRPDVLFGPYGSGPMLGTAVCGVAQVASRSVFASLSSHLIAPDFLELE